MTSNNIYYVYQYLDPITRIPFYVGYGKGNRRWNHLDEATRHPKAVQGEHKLNKIRKLLKEDSSPIIEIIRDGLSKEEANLLEIEIITRLGRVDLGNGPLTNQTNGGDGRRDWTEAQRKELSDARVGFISVMDLKTKKKFRIHESDPRWVSGELVGHNLGLVGVTNKTGSLTNLIMAKNPITGEIVRVHNTDPKWLSGELVGINKGVKPHPNTIAAAKARKGIPKSAEHAKKVGKAFSGAVWIHNFTTDTSKRLTKGNITIPEGFVKVSGPHKKIIL